MELYILFKKKLITNSIRHRGVIRRGEYGYFLRFQIRQQFNNLILNLLDEKLTYEQIANKLNEMNYRTLRGKSFNKGNVFKIVWNIIANRRIETKPIYSNFKLYFIKSKI